MCVPQRRNYAKFQISETPSVDSTEARVSALRCCEGTPPSIFYIEHTTRCYTIWYLLSAASRLCALLLWCELYDMR